MLRSRLALKRICYVLTRTLKHSRICETWQRPESHDSDGTENVLADLRYVITPNRSFITLAADKKSLKKAKARISTFQLFSFLHFFLSLYESWVLDWITFFESYVVCFCRFDNIFHLLNCVAEIQPKSGMLVKMTWSWLKLRRIFTHHCDACNRYDITYCTTAHHTRRQWFTLQFHCTLEYRTRQLHVWMCAAPTLTMAAELLDWEFHVAIVSSRTARECWDLRPWWATRVQRTPSALTSRRGRSMSSYKWWWDERLHHTHMICRIFFYHENECLTAGVVGMFFLLIGS